jgi:hypothetical protein
LDFGKTEIFFREGVDRAKARAQAVSDLPVGQSSLALTRRLMMTRAAIGRLRVPHTQLVIPGHREAMSYDVQLHIRES